MVQQLPNIKELRKMERDSKRRLRKLFKSPALKPFRAHLKIGIARLTVKGSFSRMVARYMKHEGIRTVEELAGLLYQDGPQVEAISWIRYPCAFRPGTTKKLQDDYLLALCDITRSPED